MYSGKNKRYLTPAAKCEEGPAEHTDKGDHGQLPQAQGLTSLLICNSYSIYLFLLAFILIYQGVHQLLTNCLLRLLLCSKTGLHWAWLPRWIFSWSAARLPRWFLQTWRWRGGQIVPALLHKLHALFQCDHLPRMPKWTISYPHQLV